MSKFLRKTQFEHVIKSLWDRSKEKFVEDITFNDVTKILSKTKNGQTSDVIDLSTYAKKDEENHFTEDNLFKDVFLESVDPYVENLGNYTSVAGGVKKTGRRDFTSHSNGNSGYVESLLIRVRSDKNAGDTTNVSVWEVTKAQDASNDVANQIVTNTQMSVIDYGNGVKCIEVPISKKYQDETYFIFQLSPSTDMAYYDATSSIEDFIYIDGDLPVDGNSINTYKNQQYVGICGLTGDAIKVRDMLSNISNNFVQDITFDIAPDPQTNKPKNTLKKTINGQLEDVIDHVVTEWQDLEYTTQSTNFNIFNPSTFEHGKYYNSIGTLASDTNWGNFKIPCSGGDTFTLFKKTHDSINLGLLSGGRWVQNLKVSYNNDNGWVKYTINIPQTGQFDSISIPVHKQTNNYKSGVMLFSGDVQAPAEFIPFTNNRVVSIDGENVAITFDSSGTTLTSGTTVDAIKELDSKIINAGGGTVTSVNGEQPQNGEVTLTATVTQNVGQNIVLVVGNQNNFATLECMTEQEADNIIAGFTL